MSDAEPRARAELDIDADPDRVWWALTTDGGLAPWMGDGATLDPRPGGRVSLPDPVGGATRRGQVERVDEGDGGQGRRLVFTWWPALRPAEQTSVAITVTPIDDGTRVRVVEQRIDQGRQRRVGANAPRATGARATAGRAGPGGAVHRLPTGLWAWRLAVLAVSTTLSRI